MAVKWLTNHPVYSDVSIVETHMVKMDDNKFELLWTEQDDETNLFYAVVDGTGKLLHERTKLGGIPSPGNMAPLVRGNKVIWYSYDYVYQNQHEQDGVEIFTLQID